MHRAGASPRRDRPPGFTIVYVVSLLFSLPIFVFSSPYAAVGGMTVAHGLQYLFLVSLVAGTGRGAGRVSRGLVLGNVALLGGALLWARPTSTGRPRWADWSSAPTSVR